MGPRNVAAILACVLAGCGDGNDAPVDAMVDAGPCWPLPSTPGGSVELGTGDLTFEPMPDELPIIVDGTQSDPFMRIYGRIRGIPPGNPISVLDPANPHTKVSATLPALGVTLALKCPASVGYVESPEAAGAFDLSRALRIGIGQMPLADVVGNQAIIVIEVVGTNHLYARAEKTVTLTTNVPLPPPMMDAGVADAPAADAPAADAAP